MVHVCFSAPGLYVYIVGLCLETSIVADMIFSAIPKGWPQVCKIFKDTLF